MTRPMTDPDDVLSEPLQRAAHEAINAARRFLDLADELVKDPKALSTLVAGIPDVLRTMASAFTPAGGHDEHGAGEGRDETTGDFERIRVG
jgi:hypothetical protein